MFNQKSSSKELFLLAFLSAALVVVFDQITKSLQQEQAVFNQGIAFSWWSGAEALTLLLTVFFLLLTAFVSWQLLTEKRWTQVIAYGALLGGGFSNLLDRWLFAGVRDIWTVPFFSLSNNLADWAIFLAAVFLIFSEIIPMYSYLWNRK